MWLDFPGMPHCILIRSVKFVKIPFARDNSHAKVNSLHISLVFIDAANLYVNTERVYTKIVKIDIHVKTF